MLLFSTVLPEKYKQTSDQTQISINSDKECQPCGQPGISESDLRGIGSQTTKHAPGRETDCEGSDFKGSRRSK
jgi:hypothetical protein